MYQDMNHILFSLKIGQILLDAFYIFIAFALAYVIRIGSFQSSDFPFWPYISISFSVTIAWIGFLIFARVYTFDQNPKTFRHFQRIVFGGIVGISAFSLTFFFTQKVFFSRLILVYLFLFATFFLVLNHLFFHWISKELHKKGIGVARTLIIGTNRRAIELIHHLITNGSYHHPVAILDGYGSKQKEIKNVPVLGKLDVLEKVVEENNIDQIIQTDNIEHTINLIQFSKQKNLRYAMLPSLLGMFEGTEKVARIEGIPIVRVESKKSFLQELWEI